MKLTQFISRNLPIVITLLLGGFIYILSSCNAGPDENSRYAQTQRGYQHYKQYCASCHGEDGKGVQIDSLARQPKDLTLIQAIRRTEEFPILEIARKIDGRKVPAHLDSGMPVWGEKFAEEELLNEDQIKGKLAEIIAYLMSIQQ